MPQPQLKSKKKSFKPMPKPRLFSTTLQELSPYQDIRLTEEAANDWLPSIYNDLQTPNSSLAASFHHLVDLQNLFFTHLRDKPWAKVSNWDLVTYLHCIAGNNQGVIEFLPLSLRRTSLHEGTTFALYLLNFVIHALALWNDNANEDFGVPESLSWPTEDRLLLPALRPLWFNAAGPFAFKEFQHRRKQQVGADAGILFVAFEGQEELVRAWTRAYQLDADKLFNSLGKDLVHRLPTFEEHAIRDQLHSLVTRLAENRRGPTPSQRRRPKSRAQLHDPGEFLARALKGEMNHLVCSMKNRLIDEWRRNQRQKQKDERKQENVGEARRKGPEGGSVSIPVMKESAEEKRPSINIENVIEQLNPRVRHPRQRHYLRVLLTQPKKPLAQLAKELGIAERTLRNWNKELFKIPYPAIKNLL